MKIATVTASISRQGGGLMESVLGLGKALNGQSAVQLSVYALKDAGTEADLRRWSPMQPRVFKGPLAPALTDSLLKEAPDLVHHHGLWTYTSCAVRKWHDRTGNPYLISPHGMLDGWALENSRRKKQLALALFERRHLESASAFHALNEAEARAIRALGLKQPILIIPNGVEAAPALEADGPLHPYRRSGRRILLYVGRLHPKKNLHTLVCAWAAVQNQAGGGSWLLVLAGWDQAGHERELRKLATSLGLVWADQSAGVCAENIGLLFSGPVFGAAKSACYEACDAFVLPSLSEGLPMTVLEAWSQARPVLMTAACNLPEGLARGAAWEMGTDLESIKNNLRRLFATPEVELRAMGRQGHDLVEGHFRWNRIATEMTAGYRWLCGQGPVPDALWK